MSPSQQQLESDLAALEGLAAAVKLDPIGFARWPEVWSAVKKLKGIRAVRSEIKRLGNDDPLRAVVNFADSYSTSMCRDLLFHI